MPSERKWRELYVNGWTICIEFFFCLFQISASARCVTVTERNEPRGALNKRFAGRKLAKIASVYMFTLPAALIVSTSCCPSISFIYDKNWWGKWQTLIMLHIFVSSISRRYCKKIFAALENTWYFFQTIKPRASNWGERGRKQRLLPWVLMSLS